MLQQSNVLCDTCQMLSSDLKKELMTGSPSGVCVVYDASCEMCGCMFLFSTPHCFKYKFCMNGFSLLVTAFIVYVYQRHRFVVFVAAPCRGCLCL